MTSQSQSQPIDLLQEAERLLAEYRELEHRAEAKLREAEAAFRKINLPLPLFAGLDEAGR